MLTFKAIAESLTASLKLQQSPVAISLLNAVPEGVPFWMGATPAGCRFWQEATTTTFATTPRNHDLCAIGVYTHNLEGTEATNVDLGAALKVFGDLGYVRPEDVPQIPVLGQRPGFVVYGPLGEAPANPDVVLLFVQASQTLVLSEAAQQLEGGAPPALGRPACAIIPQAVNSNRTALSLGCCGARAYLDILKDEVAIFAVPGPVLATFAERVAALSKANDTLTLFHTVRRRDVESGKVPTVAESLAAMSA